MLSSQYNSERVQYFMKIYNKVDSVWKTIICEILAQIYVDEEIIIDFLIEKLKSKNPTIRYVVVESLGNIRSKKSSPYLVTIAANDTGKDYGGLLISEAAREAINKIGSV